VLAVMMANPEISLAISATSFGLIVGFLAGYAVRAYISYRRRLKRYGDVEGLIKENEGLR
jgi:hypothetical protein